MLDSSVCRQYILLLVCLCNAIKCITRLVCCGLFPFPHFPVVFMPHVFVFGLFVYIFVSLFFILSRLYEKTHNKREILLENSHRSRI